MKKRKEISPEELLREFLLSSGGTITLEEARKRHKKMWPE